jgi:hypothetical protein
MDTGDMTNTIRISLVVSGLVELSINHLLKLLAKFNVVDTMLERTIFTNT